MTLTGPQKRKLKSIAQTMDDSCVVGGDGATAAFLAHAGDLLNRGELIKIRFGELHGADRKAFGQALAEKLHAECIAVIGRTALLYRANPELDASRRVLAGN